MKKMFIIFFAVFMSFFVAYANNEVEDKNEVKNIETEEQIGADTEEKKEVDNKAPKKYSELEDFENTIHYIRNPKTGTQMIFRGDGKIILSAIDKDFSRVELINDAKTNEANYCSKTFSGDEKREYTYKATGADEGDWTDYYPSIKTIIYDKNGKEVGLELDETSGVDLAIGDYIAYYKQNESRNGVRQLVIFNAKTKETFNAAHENIYYFNNKIIISSDPYNDKDVPKEFIIMDDDFKAESTFSNYSFVGEAKIADMNFGRLVNKNNSDKDKYNYIDHNFNLIFEKDVDTFIYEEKEPVQTIKCGNKEFEFDFNKLEKVSDEREVNEEESGGNKYLFIENMYKATKSEIQKLDEHYSYVSVAEHEGDVVYFAEYTDASDENNVISYTDIYDDNMNLVLNNVSVTLRHDDGGVFVVNNDTAYDFKFNILKKFDTKVSFSYQSKKDVTYFADSMDEEYKGRDRFNLYDTKFNVVLENISYIDSYAFDDYFAISYGDGTKIVDKDFNTIFEFEDNRKFAYGYSINNKYIDFTNTDTGRMGVMDNDYNDIVKNLKFVSDMKDEYFTYQNGFTYGLMDYTGKELISFSIFDSFDEDKMENNMGVLRW